MQPTQEKRLGHDISYIVSACTRKTCRILILHLKCTLAIQHDSPLSMANKNALSDHRPRQDSDARRIKTNQNDKNLLSCMNVYVQEKQMDYQTRKRTQANVETNSRIAHCVLASNVRLFLGRTFGTCTWPTSICITAWKSVRCVHMHSRLDVKTHPGPSKPWVLQSHQHCAVLFSRDSWHSSPRNLRSPASSPS